MKAGWLIKSGGSWSLTDAGREAYRSFPEPEVFEREAVRGYRAWEKERQPEQEVEEASEAVESTGTLEEAQDSAWAEIRAYLTTMPPYDFQRLVGALLKAMGYYVDWIAPPGPDGGIDLIAHTDPLGTTGPRIKVQVKRRDTEKVSAESLRAFMAVLAIRCARRFVRRGDAARARPRTRICRSRGRSNRGGRCHVPALGFRQAGYERHAGRSGWMARSTPRRRRWLGRASRVRTLETRPPDAGSAHR